MDSNRDNIELVKAKTDIVAVVQRYVNLKQTGKNNIGLCPFHQEKTPSFNVSENLQIFKCFGCGKTGDVITFVQEIEKIDFVQALEKLAKEAGVTLSKSNTPIPIEYQLNKWAQLYYSKALYSSEGKEALNYLYSRGIKDNEIEKFQIGYSVGDNSFLERLRETKNLKSQTLINSGLFILKNGTLKEKFYKRIVFPIQDNLGKIIAFTARKLPDNEYGPKYLNSPETKIYQKRNTLYGMYQAKASIKKEDICIIVEGQTDVIALHRAGYTNTCAPLGTGLTKEQLTLIKNYTDNILFIFDTDSAGQAALERAFMLCTEIGITTYALSTGKYKDIDEFLRDNSKNEVKNLIEKRQDCFSYLLTEKALKTGTTTLKSLMLLKRYVKTLLQRVSDETELSYYNNKIAQLIPELKIESIQAHQDNEIKEYVKSETFNPEEALIKIIDKKIIDKYSVTEGWFSDPLNKRIFSDIRDRKAENISELYKITQDKHLKSKIESIELFDYEGVETDSIVNRIKFKLIELKLKSLRVALALAEEKEDTGGITELTLKIVEYSNKRNKLKNLVK